MKKLLTFLLVLSSYGAAAQEYRPMAEFGTDTIAYMQYNFIDRQDQYIGKPLAVLLNDYELCLMINSSQSYLYAPGANGKSWIDGAYVDYSHTRDDYTKPYGVLFISPPPISYFTMTYTTLSLTITRIGSWRRN